MQGAGNDYVYVDCTKGSRAIQKTDFKSGDKSSPEADFPDTEYAVADFVNGNPELISELIQYVSDRHFGVGSDGMVFIMPSKESDFRMRMFNSDGSEAEMCGNASRCVGKFLYDKGLTDKKEISLETKAGVKYLTMFTDTDNKVSKVTVDMGEPILESALIPVESTMHPVVDEDIEVDGKSYKMTCVSMGNPHAVVFWDGIDDMEIEKIGPGFENHSKFPRRTNTEFVEVVSPSLVKMRVWERGAGETLACGTGACATLVACVLNNKSDRKAVIRLLGGDLEIEWDEKTGHVLMSGGAKTVFDGELDWEN